jgi:hypothetical protein
VPDGFEGYPNFVFLNPVPLTPAVSYYFQPVLESGDAMIVAGDGGYKYPGGTMFIQGSPALQDLWFREGIIVPEPSSAWLALVGAGVLGWWHWGRRKRFNHGGGDL